MEITLLTIGTTTIDFVKAGIENYLKRLKHYVPFSITEIRDVKGGGGMTQERQKQLEGEELLRRMSQSDLVVLLDERGKEYRSVEFATQLEKWQLSGRKRIVFAVGGPYGFSESIYARADAKLSLSRMTFNHEMVRLFFIEQIYRAQTILRGEPYHHE